MQQPSAHRPLAVLTLFVLAISAFTIAIVIPSPARAASATSSSETTVPTMLFDNYTQDTALDTSLWQINGPVGVIYGPDEVGQTVVPLEPAFSPTGMKIAQVNGKQEVGTIQSIASFSPPFNATATVEGTVSNGHTFGFAITSADAGSGVVVYGNLNPSNCSHLNDCGIPLICGIPANSTIGRNECFYGIDAKTGTGGGSWSDLPKLYLDPSVNVFYTIDINVSASGTADYSISQGGKVLGSASTPVGTGPFYIILEQGEGGPISQPGPNVAYWQSVSVTAFTTCAAPLAPLAQSSSSADPPSNCVPVYPTEASFTTISLNYPSLSSPIQVAVVKDSGLPLGVTVTFRAPGTSVFTSALTLQPSASGTSTIKVNVTLNCVTGNCDQPGGVQLPTSYSLKIRATSVGYTQNTIAQLDLLKAKWLIMLYCATEDLRDEIHNNVNEMVSASKANNNPAVGMLVYSSSAIGLWEIANGTIKSVGGTWPQTDIYNPATLHKFLVTSMAMIPADRNQLILAGHGSGMMGYGVAVGFGPHAYMSVTGLASALSGISPKLEILSFDACYMGQLEVLYQLSGYANYFTASELPEPGEGYNYTGFVTPLLQNPDQSTAAYLNVIVSTYRAKYMSPKFQSEYPRDIFTLAAINSSQLGGVVSGLNTLSLALSKDYAAKNPSFNTTMLSVLGRTWLGFTMYGDIRSFAQNILNSPGITDPAVKAAASALVLDLKAAVIANTTIGRSTTPMMYEGLTVLLFNGGNVYWPFYGTFTGVEAGLSFAGAANWLPLLQNINRSTPASSASMTVVTLKHPAHQLYLNVYNSTGGHTGYNPAILNSTGSGLEIIPGTYYLDFGNGTAFVVLPSSMQNFTTVVDGSAMEEASENYTLTYTVIQNGTVTSAKTVEGTISNGTLQSASVTIQNGVLALGATLITTPSGTTITSSTTSTTSPTSAAATTTTSLISSTAESSTSHASSSAISTTTSSSTGSRGSESSSSSTGGSSFGTAYAIGLVVAVIVVAAVLVMARRHKPKQ